MIIIYHGYQFIKSEFKTPDSVTNKFVEIDASPLENRRGHSSSVQLTPNIRRDLYELELKITEFTDEMFLYKEYSEIFKLSENKKPIKPSKLLKKFEESCLKLNSDLSTFILEKIYKIKVNNLHYLYTFFYIGLLSSLI